MELYTTRDTVLVEIIRDSKNKYFFQRSRIIMVEISRSRIIRITNYSARTYIRESLCAQLHTHARVYRCKGDGCSRDLHREQRRLCGAGGRERKDLCSTACWTISVTSATVRGATRTASVRKDVQTARR